MEYQINQACFLIKSCDSNLVMDICTIENLRYTEKNDYSPTQTGRSWSVDPRAGSRRSRPAVPPACSGSSSRTRTGRDTSCTWCVLKIERKKDKNGKKKKTGWIKVKQEIEAIKWWRISLRRSRTRSPDRDAVLIDKTNRREGFVERRTAVGVHRAYEREKCDAFS